MSAQVAPWRRSSQARWWLASRFGDVLRPGLEAAKNTLTSGSRAKVADDRTNGTDMELKPLGDFGGGYRFAELGTAASLLMGTRARDGGGRQNRGKTGLTTPENECQKGKLRLRENRRTF